MACLAVSGSAWRWGPRRAWSSGFFFFQAEDGIRAGRVPGVQTCALPILRGQVLHLRDVATRIDGKRGRDAGTYAQDRKSVVEGKSVDLGGCGIIKKKKNRVDKFAGGTAVGVAPMTVVIEAAIVQ